MRCDGAGGRTVVVCMGKCRARMQGIVNFGLAVELCRVMVWASAFGGVLQDSNTESFQPYAGSMGCHQSQSCLGVVPLQSLGCGIGWCGLVLPQGWTVLAGVGVGLCSLGLDRGSDVGMCWSVRVRCG